MRRSIILLVLLTACWLLAACGGSSTDAAPGAVSPGEAPSVVRPGEDVQGSRPDKVQPIRREAECAFPAQMQVGRPATVRFSVFPPGTRPDPMVAPGSTIEPVTIPQRPDLETWVAVSLDVNGQIVSQNAERQFQQINQYNNTWTWQITPTTAAPIVLQPIVDVEYRNAEGQIVERVTSVWTQTYTVEHVTGPGFGSVAASWLGDSVSELISGMIGSLLMAGVVNPARGFFNRRFGKQPLA